MKTIKLIHSVWRIVENMVGGFLRLGRLAPGWGAIQNNGYDALKVVGRKAHLDVRIIRLSTIFVPWKAVLA